VNAVAGLAKAGIAAQSGRSARRTDLWRTGAAYVLAAVLAGTLTGLVIGGLGGLVANQRPGIATTIAIAGVVGGMLEVAGVLPFQFNRETPFGWVLLGPYKWGLLNGATLGNAMTTRVGFWLWFGVPATALLVGSAPRGALVYGCYAMVRAGAVYWQARNYLRGVDFVSVAIARYEPARTMSGVLVIVGALALALGYN